MTTSLEGWSTKAKEAPSRHEVRLPMLAGHQTSILMSRGQSISTDMSIPKYSQNNVYHF